VIQVLLLLIAAWSALVAHECGHIVAGLLLRFRFGILVVGPFWLVREGRRVRLRWRFVPAAFGGVALAYPTDPRNLGFRIAAYAGGGPAASLAVALGAYAIAVWLPPETCFARFASALAIVSAGVLLATVQPWGTGMGVPSDGGRVLLYLSRRHVAEAEAAVQALDALAAGGVRPRDWSQALVEQAVAVNEPPAMALAAGTSLLRQQLDRGDFADAGDTVDRLIPIYDKVPALLRGDSAAEFSFFLSFVRRNPSAASEYLEDAAHPLTERHRVLRAQAAVLLRSGDTEGATVAAGGALAALDGALMDVTALDRDLIEAVQHELASLQVPVRAGSQGAV